MVFADRRTPGGSEVRRGDMGQTRAARFVGRHAPFHRLKRPVSGMARSVLYYKQSASCTLVGPLSADG